MNSGIRLNLRAVVVRRHHLILLYVGPMVIASAGFTYKQTKHLLMDSGHWGPPEVKRAYCALALRRTRSRGGLAIWAMPGGLHGVDSYVTIG